MTSSQTVSSTNGGFDAKQQELSNKAFRALEREPEAQLENDAIPVMAEALGLSQTEVSQLKIAFLKFDQDSSSLLSVKELDHLISDLGEKTSPEEIQRMIRRVDKDMNGQVDFIEFLNMMCVMPAYREMVLEHHVVKLGGLVTHMEETRQRPGDEKVVAEKGIPMKLIKTMLRREIAEADACLELPFTATLFILYTIGVMMHMKFWILNSVDYAIVFDITENANFAFTGIAPFENGRMGHKIFSDINNIPDFWSWFSIGLVPMLWIEAWDVSEPPANVLAMCAGSKDALKGFGYDSANAGKSEWEAIFKNCPAEQPQELPPEFYGPAPKGMYLYFNRMLGGVRLRAEARTPEKCPGPPDLVKEIFDGPCFPSDYWLEPDLHSGLQINKEQIDKPTSPTEILRGGASQSDVRKELFRLEKEKWLNPAVQKVEISFVTYNGHVDAITITFINFFFNRGGHIIKQMESMSLWLHPYGGEQVAWYLYVIDFIWLSMVLKILVNELIDVKSYLCELGLCAGLMKYIGFWNAIDWVSVTSAIQLMARWIQQLGKISSIREKMESANLNVTGSWESKDDILEFHEMVEEAALFSVMLRRLLAFYLMAISARCFKAFHAQPRLAMVTKTLQQAAMDILHFGIVLLAVFMSFVTSGIMLFGEELPEFSHFDRAINTCWRLILGDFDWDGLYSAATRFIAGIWFIAFTILVVQIMLNMLLAVVMDVYTQVKSQTVDAKTLPRQAYELYIQYRGQLRGETLSLQKVLHALDPTSLDDDDDGPEDDRLVNLEVFISEVPDLPKTQAIEILQKAALLVDDNSEKDMSISGAMEKVCTLYEREEKCHYCIEQLMFLCSMIADKVATIRKPQAPRKSTLASAEGGGDSAAGRSIGGVPDPTPPKLPPVLADTLERAALGKLETRLRSLNLGREQMLHQAESTAKNLESRLANLDRQVAALVQETHCIQQGVAESRNYTKQGRVTEMGACTSCIVFSNADKA